MYNEDSYSRHLTWVKVKRVFFMILFSIIGCVLGVIISSFVVTVLLYDQMLRPIIIAISTILFFFLSLFCTSNTAKEVQDGYWKVALLKKLTAISQKLDSLDNLTKLGNLDKLNNLDKLEKLEILDKLDIISKQLSNYNLITEKETNNIENESTTTHTKKVVKSNIAKHNNLEKNKSEIQNSETNKSENDKLEKNSTL